MDYKHVEELLERYWLCETSSEEEAELRSFFTSEDVPPALLHYRDVFIYQAVQQEVGVGEGFEQRVLAQIEPKTVKAKRLTLVSRFTPLLKAVAIVTLVLGLSNAVQRTFFVDDVLVGTNDTCLSTPNEVEVAEKQGIPPVNVLTEKIGNSEVTQMDSLQSKDIEKPIDR
ncbi:hypothetical protein [Bacteroides sp. 224]|uniref:hypothetical protein n=1 Tax=Bacteroides sp. 224 TaxID=2302936 RepID=UPI0013D175FE|nr:hypothetical protein [Bacteroides sp. 224]NDV64285.1 hypothetical protein [Bacteroides sp. 224]